MKKASVLFFVSIFALSSYAAIDRRKAKSEKQHSYIENGVISGGTVNTRGGSLLNVRRFFAAKDKIDRILIDLGDEKGQPLKNQIHYFQVIKDKTQKRVVIELPQMLGANVTDKRIREAFASSPFVKSARINYDPVDSNITIQLQLKSEVKVEAFQMPTKDKASRIIIDLKGQG